MNNKIDSETSISLVKAISDGCPETEEQFVNIYRPSILTKLIGMTQDRARAEDITQETLIIVLQKIRNDEIREPKKLTGFVHQTAKYCYFGWLRKLENQIELREQFNDIPSTAANAENFHIDHQREKFLHLSINKMRVTRDREILSRHYIHGQSKPEICAALLLPVNSYDRVICRARLRLRENMSTRQEFAEHCA
ncbi:MAG: sigma-70 family RNA polymerase sigma factor [Pseudomonadales bacterium]|nr:sigma-70 family RNA polymerase sigma factor [Pseudomonadales bacterium]